MPIRYFQNKDLSDAKLISLREEEFAESLRESGTHILIHRDRYWKETYPGFYEAVHWMARLKADQATNPSPLSWGFRASLEKHNARKTVVILSACLRSCLWS